MATPTRTPGVFNFSANFEALIAAPLDARITVPLKSNLTDGSTLPYPYLGMVVAVTSDPTSSNNGVYYCTNIGSTPAFASGTSVWVQLLDTTYTGGTGTDIYVTGGTVSGTNLLLNRNDGNTVTVDLSSITGGGHDYYVTGGTVSGSNLYLNLNNGSTVTIDVSSLATDSYVTGSTITGTTITLHLNNNKPDVNIDISSMLCDGIASLVATGSTVTGITTSGSTTTVTKYAPFIMDVLFGGSHYYVDMYNFITYLVEDFNPGGGSGSFQPALLTNLSVSGRIFIYTYNGTPYTYDFDDPTNITNFNKWLTNNPGTTFRVAACSPNGNFGDTFGANQIQSATSFSLISKNLLVTDYDTIYMDVQTHSGGGGSATGQYYVRFTNAYWEYLLGLSPSTYDRTKLKIIGEVGSASGTWLGGSITGNLPLAVEYNNVYYVVNVLVNDFINPLYDPVIVTGGTSSQGTIGQNLHNSVININADYDIKISPVCSATPVTTGGGETCYLRLEFALCDGTTQATLIDLSPLNNCLTVTGATQDSYVTGATVSGTTVTLNLNNGKPAVTFTITGITGTDTYVTGGTSSAGTGGTTNIDLDLIRNDAVDVNIDLSQAFTFLNTAAVKKTVGGITTGDFAFASGKTLHQIIQAIFYPAIAPTISYSSAALSRSFAGLEEIGKTANLTLSATFTRGQSVVSGQTTRQMGLPIDYNYSGSGIVGTTTHTSTSLSDTDTLSSYVVTQGSNSWSLSVNYSSAPVAPVYDDGTTYIDTAFTNSGTKTASASLEGVYPVYAATATTTVLTKQALVSMISGNNLQYTLVAESNPGEHTFALPNAWTTARPLTGVYYFNTVSNQFDPTNQIADWDTSSITETIQGNTVNYTKYTKKVALPTAGSRTIKLVF